MERTWLGLFFGSVCLLGPIFFVKCEAQEKIRELRIEMPKLETNEKEAYMCFASSIRDVEADLVGYKIDAVENVVHHVSFAVCEDVHSDSDTNLWNCGRHQGSICKGRSVNTGAWNHVKGETLFNSDIGIHLGASEKLNILLMQVHYRNIQKRPDIQDSSPANLTLYLSSKRRRYTTQLLVFVSTGFIPGNTKDFSSEMTYRWQGVPVTAIGYGIHTHKHGTLVEGYVIKNGTSTLLGRANPQHANRERLNLLSGPVTIYPGDLVAARCLFTNNEMAAVEFGMSSHHEMCNFHLYFKYDARNPLMYQKNIISMNDAQMSSWCVLPETTALCEKEKY